MCVSHQKIAELFVKQPSPLSSSAARTPACAEPSLRTVVEPTWKLKRRIQEKVDGLWSRPSLLVSDFTTLQRELFDAEKAKAVQSVLLVSQKINLLVKKYLSACPKAGSSTLKYLSSLDGSNKRVAQERLSHYFDMHFGEHGHVKQLLEQLQQFHSQYLVKLSSTPTAMSNPMMKHSTLQGQEILAELVEDLTFLQSRFKPTNDATERSSEVEASFKPF